MTNPTTPTPAEIAEIIAEAKSQNVKDWICFCPGPACDTGHPCVSVAALLSAASRGIAPMNGPEAADARDGEWQERLAPLHEGYSGDGCDSGDPIDWTYLAMERRLFDLEDRAAPAPSAPPVAAPSGEARELLSRAADRMEEKLVCDGNECLPIGGGEDAPVKHSDDCVVVLCEEIRVFLRATLRK